MEHKLMQHHLDLPKNPGTPATEILKHMPPKLGAERSEAIFHWAMMGCIPDFLCRWMVVNLAVDDHELEICCLPDFFCLGTDADWVFVPMGALTAERLAQHFNAHLPTPKLVDFIYTASTRQVAQPWGPPYDSTMTDTARWGKQTQKIRSASGFVPGALNEGHLKNVCVSKRMNNTCGEWLSFYGWFNAKGKPIQGNNVNAHGVEYADYAHGVRFIHNELVVDGEVMLFDDVLKHPVLYPLLDPEGPVALGTYTSCRAHHGVTAVAY